MKNISLLLAAVLTLSGCDQSAPPSISSHNTNANSKTADHLSNNLKKSPEYSTAVEAIKWGIPIVSVQAMREAFFRDAKAQYGDMIYFTKPANWKYQVTTPNASSYYIYLNMNTKEGPVVLELPAALKAGLFGTILDAWQVPLVDVGPEGEDKGKGGKYLILPPGYTDKIPSGYIPVKAETYNSYAIFRSIPQGSSPQDIDNAINLIKQMRTYKLSSAENPPPQNFIDISDKLFDGIVHFDAHYFDALAQMINEEPAQSKDSNYISNLKKISIEKGKPFNPDPTLKQVLNTAAIDVHQELKDEFAKRNTPYWDKSKWGLTVKTGPQTAFTFMTPEGHYDIDERALVYYLAFAPPKKLGAATFYLGQLDDQDGHLLQGDKTYRMNVPVNVPAKQFWAITVYDLDTAGFIENSPKLSIDSYDPNVQKNSDGSVDIYFGPKAPEGKEHNWIYTAPGKNWFAFFRFYGPEKALYDKSWKLGDIELLPNTTK